MYIFRLTKNARLQRKQNFKFSEIFVASLQPFSMKTFHSADMHRFARIVCIKLSFFIQRTFKYTPWISNKRFELYCQKNTNVYVLPSLISSFIIFLFFTNNNLWFTHWVRNKRMIMKYVLEYVSVAS